MSRFGHIALGLGLSFALCSAAALAEDKAPTAVGLSENNIRLQVPGTWNKKQPKSNIIEAEFEIPAVEGDAAAGRLTMMGAGGNRQANLDRWFGQFIQPDGSNSKDKAKVEEKKIANQAVVVVDIAGTYKDSPAGPFAGGKTINRDGYRMLAAIIETKDHGNYYVKLYGPAKTIAASEKGFREMIDSLQVTEDKGEKK